MQKLLTKSNPKIEKGLAAGYLSFGLHLAPEKLSGYQVCASASAGCRAACLNTAGRGRMNPIQESRIKKTKFFKENQKAFLDQLRKEITNGIKYAIKKELKPCFRLNLTSDVNWEKFGIMQEFPDVQFYDYTNHFRRAKDYCNGLLPDNYYLTFSRSESNQRSVNMLTTENAPINVAVAFDSFPKEYNGRPVVDGDKTDLRFLDPIGSIVGLIPKGKAKKDETGFVVKSA